MSTENDNDRDRMRLFVQGRSPDIDARIAETKLRLANTRFFLDNIAESQQLTREHISEMLFHIERELQSLHKIRDKNNDSLEPEQEG